MMKDKAPDLKLEVRRLRSVDLNMISGGWGGRACCKVMSQYESSIPNSSG